MITAFAYIRSTAHKILKLNGRLSSLYSYRHPGVAVQDTALGPSSYNDLNSLKLLN